MLPALHFTVNFEQFSNIAPMFALLNLDKSGGWEQVAT